MVDSFQRLTVHGVLDALIKTKQKEAYVLEKLKANLPQSINEDRDVVEFFTRLVNTNQKA